MAPDNDEFFVGYLPAMPREHGRAVRRAVAVIATGLVVLAVLLSTLVNRPARATWDEAAVTLTGTLVTTPYPMVVSDDQGEARTVLVVAERKFGALDRLNELRGTRVMLRGTVLERDGRRMFELSDAPDAVSGVGNASEVTMRDLGPVILRGQIVDSKCYSGAMKPGEGKEHRACAVRCISGGIPPGFVVDDAAGAPFCVLADQNGGPLNAVVLDYVAEHTEVRGTMGEIGDLRVLRVDPGGIVRVP